MFDSGPPRRSASLYSAVVFFFALVGAASMVYYHLGLFIPNVLASRAHDGVGNGYSFGDDFYPVWLTTRQWRIEHRDLYGAEMTREIQIGLSGRPVDPHNPLDPPVDYRQFAYPAFTDLLFWPSVSLDFPALRRVLLVLLLALTVLSIVFWLRALDWNIGPVFLAILALLTLSTYELLEAFFALQPGLFCGFFLAAAALALRRNRLMLAGALLSLTLIKPQMTLLAIGYLLLWSCSDRRRARFVLGFTAVTITLLASSLWIWPNWIREWVAILFGYHRYAMPPLVMVLLGKQLGPYIGPLVIAAVLGVGIVVAWRNRSAPADSSRFWLTMSLLLAIGSITLLPGQAIYDHIILIPGILLVIRYRREIWNAGLAPRVLLAVEVLVLFWPWLSAFFVVALRPWTAAVSEGTTVFTLPIRMAAPLPFSTLALIAYARQVILNAD